MPSAQTTMGARATPNVFGAANRLQRRTGASSAIAAFASNAPSETTQSCGVAQPHFFIECEDLRRQAGAHTEPASSNLPHLIRLTRREQEVARLVCEGRSNQEIADAARLSLPMVKKHLHAIFRKLEVSSRSPTYCTDAIKHGDRFTRLVSCVKIGNLHLISDIGRLKLLP